MFRVQAAGHKFVDYGRKKFYDIDDRLSFFLRRDAGQRQDWSARSIFERAGKKNFKKFFLLGTIL